MKAPELTVAVDNLTDRMNALGKTLDELNAEHRRTLQALNDYRVAVLDSMNKLKEENLYLKRDVEELKKWKDDQKKEKEESSRRKWAFGPNIVGAIITITGSVVTLILSSLISFYILKKA